MAVAQLIISALGLIWFIFGNNGLNVGQQITTQNQINARQNTIEWIYRGRDNQYYYYSDCYGNYWCRVNVFTGEVSYKL